jgi:type II secretory ATPase GspE/PulE/Tfp pilus assembly ATPase PilB-like protein
LYQHFQFEPGRLDDRGEEIEPCPKCSGIGFYERTGIFEILIIDDVIRQAIVRTPRMDRLMSAAKASGHLSMRDLGIVAVASGVTTLEELQRMLKA